MEGGVLTPLVLVPDEKKASSDIEAMDSEPTARARDPLARPALGGGVTMISRPSVDPLDTVTGEPSPMMAPASPRPKPNPGRASLARRRADSNSSPRSVMDVVRRSELLRLGTTTHGSPGCPRRWFGWRSQHAHQRRGATKMWWLARQGSRARPQKRPEIKQIRNAFHGREECRRTRAKHGQNWSVLVLAIDYIVCRAGG